MNPIYDSRYRELYYGYDIDGDRWVGLVREHLAGDAGPLIEALAAIKDAIEEAGDHDLVRADAKYFLLLNFFELGAAPLILGQARYEARELSLDGLLSDTAQDVRLVVHEAAKNSDPIEGITAHGIIDSMRDIWERLRLSNSLTWI